MPPQSVSAPRDDSASFARAVEIVIPLWDLEVGGQVVRPAIPVGIKLRREGDCFLAENDALALYGSGFSPEDAIADFRATASYFVAEYRSLGPDDVVGLGARLRETFLLAFPL